MKISQNFDVREFVPKSIWDAFGESSKWFIDIRMVKLAEFYKQFFKAYYKADNVLIIANNWHTGGEYQFRGYRPRSCNVGGENSQHRRGTAFDCDIIIIKGKQRIEANYKEIHQVIKQNQKEFMDAGLTTIEDVAFAPTWLHSDNRNTGLDTILIVKP